MIATQAGPINGLTDSFADSVLYTEYRSGIFLASCEKIYSTDPLGLSLVVLLVVGGGVALLAKRHTVAIREKSRVVMGAPVAGSQILFISSANGRCQK